LSPEPLDVLIRQNSQLCPLTPICSANHNFVCRSRSFSASYTCLRQLHKRRRATRRGSLPFPFPHSAPPSSTAAPLPSRESLSGAAGHQCQQPQPLLNHALVGPRSGAHPSPRSDPIIYSIPPSTSSHHLLHPIIYSIPLSTPSHHLLHPIIYSIPPSTPSHHLLHPIIYSIPSSTPSHHLLHPIIYSIPSSTPSHHLLHPRGPDPVCRATCSAPPPQCAASPPARFLRRIFSGRLGPKLMCVPPRTVLPCAQRRLQSLNVLLPSSRIVAANPPCSYPPCRLVVNVAIWAMLNDYFPRVCF
jgi:hypothetical protein